MQPPLVELKVRPVPPLFNVPTILLLLRSFHVEALTSDFVLAASKQRTSELVTIFGRQEPDIVKLYFNLYIKSATVIFDWHILVVRIKATIFA